MNLSKTCLLSHTDNDLPHHVNPIMLLKGKTAWEHQQIMKMLQNDVCEPGSLHTSTSKTTRGGLSWTWSRHSVDLTYWLECMPLAIFATNTVHSHSKFTPCLLDSTFHDNISAMNLLWPLQSIWSTLEISAPHWDMMKIATQVSSVCHVAIALLSQQERNLSVHLLIK